MVWLVLLALLLDDNKLIHDKDDNLRKSTYAAFLAVWPVSAHVCATVPPPGAVRRPARAPDRYLENKKRPTSQPVGRL